MGTDDSKTSGTTIVTVKPITAPFEALTEPATTMSSTATMAVVEAIELPAIHIRDHQYQTQLPDDQLPETPRHVSGASTPNSTASSARQRIFSVSAEATLSKSSRAAITSLLVIANLIQFISNFVTIAGGFALSEALGRKAGPGQANWMASSYSLTQGAFVLISGRLGSIYGYQRVSLLGGLLFTVFSLANAFAKSYDSFIAVRALTGVGGGIFMPNAVALITTMVPPGKMRNVFMGFFAASPPIGGLLGAVMAGVFTRWVSWMWMFVLIAGSSALVLGCLWYLLPKEHPVDKNGKLDVVGAVLGLGSLLLFNIVWNQAPSVGWQTPYEIACLLLSIALFALFLLWESRYASDPVMPLAIFRGAPTFSALILVVLLTYMGFGIALWYSICWQQQLRDATTMDVAVHFVPFGIGSVGAVFFAAWLIPRVAAQWIMALGVVVIICSCSLLATMPVVQNWWFQLFPATVLAGLCPDFVYIAAQVIASNSVSRKHQGVASSLIGTLNLYGVSLGLGFAGTIESAVNKAFKGTGNPVRGYRASLIFGAGLAVIGLLLDCAFVRVPKDEREGWDESFEDGDDVADAVATAVDRPGHSAA